VLIPLLMPALLLGGCGSWGGGERSASADPVAEERLVARDFANALRQLDGYAPGETIVRLERRDDGDSFAAALAAELQAGGYEVRVASEEGANRLRYRRRRAEGDAGANRDVYEIAIGAVRMRREYDVRDGGDVFPSSPLYVRGADASAVRLDESIFEGASSVRRARGAAGGDAPDVPGAGADRPDGGAPLIGARADGVAPRAAPRRAVVTPVPRGLSRGAGDAARLPGELLADARDDTGRTAAVPGGTDASIAALTGGDVNMFELGTSNFDAVFTAYEDVAEAVLVFADDSLNLGRRNKRAVEAMVERFDPEQDVFSVVGCSLGPTRVEGGNAALALGRAGRVREALLFAGVDQERILDEGCWAGESGDQQLPTRGVVVTLKRARG